MLAAGLLALLALPTPPFAGCQLPTGASATLMLPSRPSIALPTGPVESGDVVAVFTPVGGCIGSGVWTGTGLAIAVWADDPYTAEVDGFVDGDVPEIRVYDASTATTYGGPDVVTRFEDGFGFDAGLSPNQVYAVEVQAVTGLEDAPPVPALVGQPHPNPSTGPVRLAVRPATAQRVVVEVYDATGRRVLQAFDGPVTAGGLDVDLRLAGLNAGLYVVRVSGETFVETRRVTVLR